MAEKRILNYGISDKDNSASPDQSQWIYGIIAMAVIWITIPSFAILFVHSGTHFTN